MNDEVRQINYESTFLRHSKFLVRYSAVHPGLKPAQAGIAGLSVGGCLVTKLIPKGVLKRVPLRYCI
jgi:hypothetical protein